MATNVYVQCRSEEHGFRYFITLKEAFAFAESNPDVWKISFDAGTGERVRLVRNEHGKFDYEPICLHPEVEE